LEEREEEIKRQNDLDAIALTTKERISHNPRSNTATSQGGFGGDSGQKCGGRKRGYARINWGQCQ
jgi:hypothetical protein